MFRIEGDISTRPRPETLIGQYGIYFFDVEEMPFGGTHTRKYSAVGSKEDMVARLRSVIGLPPDTSIEHILSPEDAEKYLSVEEGEVDIETRDKPNIIKEVEDVVPPDAELLMACVSLWHERRWPTRKRYIRSQGSLLEVLDFDKEQGWHSKHKEVSGTRITTGLVTPNRRATTVITETNFIDHN